MALLSLVSFSHAVIFILFTASVSAASESSDQEPCFKSIIGFGNSLQDTGNLPLLKGPSMLPNSARPPYGMTFFNRSTGRFSDGRLIIDFIAEHLKLPYVRPYLAVRNASFNSGNYEAGVNFAVSGDTVLDQQFYAARMIFNPRTNTSLRVEMEWFRHFLATVPDGSSFLQSSLVLGGSFGANDYGYALVGGKSIQEVRSYVPLVINQTGAYIREELSQIRESHPQVSLGYADYYNNALRIFRSPNEFGFTNANQSCCGSGGQYKFNLLVTCGTPPLVTSCDTPSRYVHWDGTHYTEEAYRVIAQGMINGSYVVPRINLLCNATSGSDHKLN